MDYAKVVFLKDVGAFVGSDGKIYGPYRSGDEAVIPEDDARTLALRGAVAIIGGYIVEEGTRPSPITLKSPASKTKFPLLLPILMSIGFVLIIVGLIIMSLSAVNVSGVVTILPFPPIVISGPEAVLIAILPIAVILTFIILFLYLTMRF
ncbi:MAG: hypothetical protein QE164_00770 [Candidatus Nezhaarchaeota archaeon]|nr:hypothetical protein [Candidatus Nezhaarchaeota archaeon]